MVVRNGHFEFRDRPGESVRFYGTNLVDTAQFLEPRWSERLADRMVKAGRDPVFGRQLFDRPIEKPPFYAVARAPSIHHTMGGLKINPRAEVLDGEGRPIPGLFAAGEVAGGIHGSNRLGGNAITDCLVFGRIAARTAMAG